MLCSLALCALLSCSLALCALLALLAVLASARPVSGFVLESIDCVLCRPFSASCSSVVLDSIVSFLLPFRRLFEFRSFSFVLSLSFLCFSL